MIKHIKASNLLSFGFNGLDLELRNLNVLIGANGSGKSNFLEIFELLRSLPRNEEDSNNLNAVFSRGGGKSEWVNKRERIPIIDIEVTALNSLEDGCLIHEISFDMVEGPAFSTVYRESIQSLPGESDTNVFSYYLKQNDYEGFSIWNGIKQETQSINSNKFSLSILSQKNHVNSGIYVLSDNYERIRLYREWSFGRNTIFRTPQRADLRNDRMEADFSNLGMFLSRLRKDPLTKRTLITTLQELYEGITDFEVIVEGGTVQIFLNEGDVSIPATRLSDGTLRYLCLIALLLDPTPPPLICIEEPELGLHPDIIPKLADLLVDASKRTQIVVTTHSDILIDALSEQPESVLVCEKENGQTHIKRLNQDDLAHWLKDYRLGSLWLSGEIGGKRW